MGALMPLEAVAPLEGLAAEACRPDVKIIGGDLAQRAGHVGAPMLTVS